MRRPAAFLTIALALATIALMIAGGATSLGASIVSAEVQKIPSSAVACYYVGRIYIDANGNIQVAGYFSDINGIGASNSLFNGIPSESTAFFTFRSDSFTNTSLPSNGDITLFLNPAGKYNIYYNPHPQGNWNNPDSFSAGEKFPGHPIAQFMRPELLVLQFESTVQDAVTATLVASQDFIFGGHEYNFDQLTPGGVTLYEYGSLTPLPPVPGFPLVLPYAGYCVAVARGDRNQPTDPAGR